jgi:hypothetical protein
MPYGSIGAVAFVSIRQHTSAYVSMRQHASTYVSIRQHTCRTAAARVARLQRKRGNMTCSSFLRSLSIREHA